jgi:SAM-dependent methyltransferase
MDTQETRARVARNLHGLVSLSLELTRVSCPVCASAQDSSLTFFNGFRIAQCKDCDFVFVNPRPTEQSLGRLYASPEQNKCAAESYEPFQYEFPVLDKILRHVRRYVSSGRLFEVGCGRGDFLKMALAEGFSPQGCDLFGDPRPNITGVTFYDGTLESVQLPSTSFDLVVIRNTLEHLFDPKRELNEIRRILSPGAYLYLKVPNFHFEYGIGCKLVFGKENSFEAPYHLNHFTPTSVRRLLDAGGFKFIGWYVEQPSLRPQWKMNLLRQSGYRIARGLQWVTGGLAFPKILLSCLAQKIAR